MATIPSHGPLDLPQYNMAVVDSIRKMMINQEFLGQTNPIKEISFPIYGETWRNKPQFWHVPTCSDYPAMNSGHQNLEDPPDSMSQISSSRTSESSSSGACGMLICQLDPTGTPNSCWYGSTWSPWSTWFSPHSRMTISTRLYSLFRRLKDVEGMTSGWALGVRSEQISCLNYFFQHGCSCWMPLLQTAESRYGTLQMNLLAPLWLDKHIKHLARTCSGCTKPIHNHKLSEIYSNSLQSTMPVTLIPAVCTQVGSSKAGKVRSALGQFTHAGDQTWGAGSPLMGLDHLGPLGYPKVAIEILMILGFWSTMFFRHVTNP